MRMMLQATLWFLEEHPLGCILSRLAWISEHREGSRSTQRQNMSEYLGYNGSTNSCSVLPMYRVDRNIRVSASRILDYHH